MSDEVENISILIRKEEKYIQGYELQEANVSRPIFAIATFEMAKVRSAMFRDPKLQFSLDSCRSSGTRCHEIGLAASHFIPLLFRRILPLAVSEPDW